MILRSNTRGAESTSLRCCGNMGRATIILVASNTSIRSEVSRNIISSENVRIRCSGWPLSLFDSSFIPCTVKLNFIRPCRSRSVPTEGFSCKQQNIEDNSSASSINSNSSKDAGEISERATCSPSCFESWNCDSSWWSRRRILWMARKCNAMVILNRYTSTSFRWGPISFRMSGSGPLQ